MKKINKISAIGIFSAISFLLMFFLEFPLPFFPGVLKYDPSDVIALIIGFKLGPLSGLLVVFLRDIVFLLMGKAPVIGVVLNLIASGSYVFSAALVYKWKRTLNGAIWGMLTGTFIMTAIMIPVNYYVLTTFYSSFLPLFYLFSVFNLVKGILNGIFTFFLYKKVSGVIFKEKSVWVTPSQNKVSEAEFDKKKMALFKEIAEFVYSDKGLKLPTQIRKQWEEAHLSKDKMKEYEKVIKDRK
jgi:riboflavin transporter FmnP